MTATDTATTPEPEKRWEKTLAAFAQIVFVLLIFLGPFLADSLKTKPRLEIVSSPIRDSLGKAFSITGRVILSSDAHGTPVRVWAIAVDSSGNRFSPADTLTDQAGRFTLGPIPLRLTSDSSHQATEVTVYGLGQLVKGVNHDTTELRGEDNLRLTQTSRIRWVDASLAELGSLALIFFATLGLGLAQVAPRFRRTKYFSLVGLCFVFTLMMIGLIAKGLRNVNASASRGDVVSLGFANVYQGTYVKDSPSEWLFSLTTPEVWKSGEATTGFGIPLWLLLIAVLGSGVYTIALIVKHVKDRRALDDDEAYSERVGDLVQHQFYMLFSPLGAILVYQLMVAAGAAKVPVTVAIVVFAAGVAVNSILDKSVKALANVLGETDEKIRKEKDEKDLKEQLARTKREEAKAKAASGTPPAPAPATA
jgi:hypothetical protein